MKLGSKVAIPVFIGFSSATGTLSAQTPPAVTDTVIADAVELKDGTYLRGLIIEVEPASHLSLRLPDGQVRRIAVEDVKSAERGGKALALGAPPAGPPLSSAVPAAGAAATGATPAAAPPAAGNAAPKTAGVEPGSDLDRVLAGIPGPRIRIETRSNRTAFLQRRIGDAADDDVVAYHLVCRVPCSVELPAADAVPYRIGYGRSQPTDWFALPKYNARVKAELVSDMYPVWMRSMLVGGFVFGVVGGSMYGINQASGKKEWAHDTGLVLLGLSGACFLTSGLFWLFSPHSTYTIERAR